MKKQLKQAVSHFRGQLQQRETQNHQQISIAHTQTKQVIQAQIKPTLDGIADKQKHGEKTPLSWLYEGKKLEKVKDAIAREVNRFGEFAKRVLERTLGWASNVGSQAAQAFYGAIAPEKASLRDLEPAILANLLTRTIGKLDTALAGMGNDTAEEVVSTLLRGVSLGTPAQKIEEEVVLTLEVPRSRVLTASSTLPTQAFKETTLLVYGENEEAIHEWIWVCQLSRNSCIACVAMHGTLHPLSEKLHDHPNGKCMAVPYSPDQTLFRSGVDWFSRQSEKTQRVILGSNLAYQLYSDGKASVSDFVGEREDSEGNRSIYQKSVKQLLKEKNTRSG